MEHGAIVEPAAPLSPTPLARPSASGDEEHTFALLGPFLLGAACGWILLSFVNLGGLVVGFTRNIQLANALWLAYLQPALLLLLTGFIAARASLWKRTDVRVATARLALALLLAWAPYLVLFALPHGILRLNSYREISDPGTQRLLSFIQIALTPAAGWLVGLLAVFVWGPPGTRGPTFRLWPTVARWLAVALVASVGFAICIKVDLLVGQATGRILSSPFDPTCGGGCTSSVVVNQLVLPVALALVFSALGGIVGGSLRFGRAFPRRGVAQPDREDTTADEGISGEVAAILQPAERIRYRTLPGSAYWGPFLLGILDCGGWLLALYLSLNMPLAPSLWRIPAQIALLLILPVGVILYAARRRARGPLPRQAVYALLTAVLGGVAMLPGIFLLARPNAGLSLLAPLFAPLFMPLFVPALSTGVAVGFAWGVRRPDEHHSHARPGGVAAALCAWVGFTLPLVGLMALEVVALRSHSITCSGYGCMIAGAITLAIFELVGTVIVFALVLLLAGLAIGRTSARGLPPSGHFAMNNG